MKKLIAMLLFGALCMIIPFTTKAKTAKNEAHVTAIVEKAAITAPVSNICAETPPIANIVQPAWLSGNSNNSSPNAMITALNEDGALVNFKDVTTALIDTGSPGAITMNSTLPANNKNSLKEKDDMAITADEPSVTLNVTITDGTDSIIDTGSFG
jgi:hypothetical protein